jgi:hypothetical protein
MAPSRARLWTTALALLAVLLVARSSGASPFDPSGDDWEGYADFVALVRASMGSSLIVTQHLDFGDIRAEDSLILVFPERRLDVDGLSSFMASGGRVILLDDFGTGDKLLKHFDIERVRLPSSPAESLRHNPELAIAEPVGNNELVRDVTRVVTNHGMGLAHPSLTTSLTTLLEVRSTARGPGGSPGEEGPSGILAALGQTSRGRLVVIGDPSTLMNSMLRYPGNAQLARNLAFFVARHGGKVYLASGAFEETGTFAGSPETSDGTGGARAAFSLGGLGGSSGLGPRAAQILAAMLGLGVVVWIGSAAGRTYKIARPRLTRVIPLFTQGGAAGHAAALGGRRAPRDAAMLEIGKALEEELTLALGLARAPLHEVLVGKLVTSGLLGRASAIPLRKLLSQVAHIDTLMSAGRTAALQRLRDADVLSAAKVAAKIRDEVRANARAGRAA